VVGGRIQRPQNTRQRLANDADGGDRLNGKASNSLLFSAVLQLNEILNVLLPLADFFTIFRCVALITATSLAIIRKSPTAMNRSFCRQDAAVSG